MTRWRKVAQNIQQGDDNRDFKRWIAGLLTSYWMSEWVSELLASCGVNGTKWFKCTWRNCETMTRLYSPERKLLQSKTWPFWRCLSRCARWNAMQRTMTRQPPVPVVAPPSTTTNYTRLTEQQRWEEHYISMHTTGLPGKMFPRM